MAEVLLKIRSRRPLVAASSRLLLSFEDALVDGVDGVGAFEQLVGVFVLLAGQMNLGQGRHLGGHAAVFGELFRGFVELDGGRGGQQGEEGSADLGAGFLPGVVDQVAVGVVAQAVVEGDAGNMRIIDFLVSATAMRTL